MTYQTRLRPSLVLKAFPWAAGGAVAAMGALALVGWALDIPAFKSVFPGLATMKANTATALVCLGIALGLSHRLAAESWQRRVGLALAVFASLVGTLTLAEYLLNRDLGIDELLFTEPGQPVGMLVPGRMAPATAFNMVLLGVALLLLDRRRLGWLAQTLSLAAIALGLLALVGYMYGVSSLYRMGPFSSMALHTASAFVLLGVGILAARPDRGLMGVLTSTSAGGVVGRRLLPVVVVVPLFLGWLRLEGQRAGLYNTEFGLALFAVSNVVVFTALTWRSATSLHRTDIGRKRAEVELRQSSARFRQVVESLPQLVWTCLPDGRCDYLSRQWCEYTGRPEAEHLGYGWLEAVHPDDGARLMNCWRASVETGERFEVEFRLRRADGPYRWFATRAAPLRDDHGHILKWFGTNNDITDRKQDEERLKDLNTSLEQQVCERTAVAEERAREAAAVAEALHQQTTTLQAILHNMAEGVVVVDAGGKFTVFNPAAEAMLGQGAKDSSPAQWSEDYGVFCPDGMTPYPPRWNQAIKETLQPPFGSLVSGVRHWLRISTLGGSVSSQAQSARPATTGGATVHTVTENSLTTRVLRTSL